MFVILSATGDKPSDAMDGLFTKKIDLEGASRVSEMRHLSNLPNLRNLRSNNKATCPE
jgi:hypothetical protein